jgi:hypothetical protein
MANVTLLGGRAGGQTLIGGTAAADDLILRATSGVGASGSDIIFQVGNNGATEALRILYDGKVVIGTAAPGHALEINAPTGDGVENIAMKFIRNTATVTNLAVSSMLCVAKTTQNMADGFGPRLRFHVEDDTSGELQIGAIGFVRDGADNQGRFIVTANATETVRFVVTQEGNICCGINSYGASAAKCVVIGNGTAPSAHLDDAIHIFSKDASSGGATLGLFTEYDVEDVGTFTATKKVKIWWNGVEYWVQLDPV